MKTLRAILILALLALTFALTAQDKDFILVRESEEDKIFIYERWIVFPKTTVRAREVKGEFTIKSSVAEALSLIKNEQRIQEWQDHVSEFKVFLSRDTTVWEEYSYHDIPWPVSDQDHFLQYQIQPGSTPDNLFITFESIVNHKRAPVKDDATRITLSGSWTIKKIDSQRIHITYRILSMPIGIPRFFTDPVIRSNIMKTIRGYIRILEKQE